jgi:beta-glucanase (GH16 family)
MGGGGNWEFEYYTNNRTNSFVEDGILHLQPTFTQDTIGENAMKTGTLDLWGTQPADTCTGNAFWGCMRSAPGSGNYLNPVQSARLRSVNSFNFKYGRAEIRAKLPKGDWIWPAIWFLPKDNAYGQWPASGEIDLVESRGNSCPGVAGGSESFGTTLHWGPDYHNDAYEKATKQYTHTESLGNDFHIYGLDWSEDGIKSSIDGIEVMNFPFDKDMWTQGGFPDGMSNPWKGETEKSAPFN